MNKFEKFLRVEEVRSFFHWLPRVLAGIYLLFILSFFLDFSISGYFFKYLIPIVLLFGALLLSWKHEILSAWSYILIALIFFVWFELNFLLAIPPLFIGGLFFFNEYAVKKYKKKKGFN